MHVEIKQIKGLAMAAKSGSGHWVAMDGPQKFGGSEAAPSPMEMVLAGLGGCLGMDTVSLIEKKGIKLKRFQMEIDAQQAEDHPRVFTNIDIQCTLSGEGLKDEHVKWAISKARESYCPVGAMLEEVAMLHVRWKIV